MPSRLTYKYSSSNLVKMVLFTLYWFEVQYVKGRRCRNPVIGMIIITFLTSERVQVYWMTVSFFPSQIGTVYHLGISRKFLTGRTPMIAKCLLWYCSCLICINIFWKTENCIINWLYVVLKSFSWHLYHTIFKKTMIVSLITTEANVSLL